MSSVDAIAPNSDGFEKLTLGERHVEPVVTASMM